MRPPSSRARNVTSHSVFGSKNAVDRRISSRRLSAQNEISLFFPQGNSESRYKERQTRFGRRIPHFPRSRGARAPGCDSFWTKVFGWTKVILFNLKYVTTFVAIVAFVYLPSYGSTSGSTKYFSKVLSYYFTVDYMYLYK
jgi:hypothetical protein